MRLLVGFTSLSEHGHPEYGDKNFALWVQSDIFEYIFRNIDVKIRRLLFMVALTNVRRLGSLQKRGDEVATNWNLSKILELLLDFSTKEWVSK